MVSLHQSAEQQVYLVPKIARISAQYWWDTVSMLADYFFERSARFRATMSPQTIAELVLSLEDIRRTVDRIGCPEIAEETRQELMDAMSSILLGISGAISNRPEVTKQHNANAKEHLARLGQLLDEMELR